MNAINEQLARLIQGALDTGQNAVDFVAAQAPDVIQQLLKWKFWEATAISFLSLLVAVVLMIFIVRFTRYANTPEGRRADADDVVPVIWIFGLPISIGILIHSIVWALDALQIYVAPKVYLIEYAAQLLSKK